MVHCLQEDGHDDAGQCYVTQLNVFAHLSMLCQCTVVVDTLHAMQAITCNLQKGGQAPDDMEIFCRPAAESSIFRLISRLGLRAQVHWATPRPAFHNI